MSKIKINQTQAICFCWLAKNQHPFWDNYGYEYFGFGVDKKDKIIVLKALFALISIDEPVLSVEIELSKQIEESPRSIDYETSPDYIDDEKIEFSSVVFKSDNSNKPDEEVILIKTDFSKKEIIIIANVNGMYALIREIYTGIKINAVVFKNKVEAKYFHDNILDSNLNRRIYFWPVWDAIPWFIS